jgi:predicted ATP-grasp superfamily ATP-dependent carboligase
MSSSPEVLAVVLTEATWGSALHALRSAKRTGARTLAVTVGITDRVLSASRYCDDSAMVDDGEVTAVARSLSGLLEEQDWPGPVVVVPLGDRLTAVLDAARDDARGNVRLSVPDRGSVYQLLRKSSSFAQAAASGLSVPAYVTVTGPASIGDALRLALPVVVRPDSALDPSGDCAKAEVFGDRTSLRRRLVELTESGARLVVQHRVEAPDDLVEFGMLWRSRDGAAPLLCTGRKRRQSHPDGGVMVAGGTEWLPDVAEATAAFADHVGFCGVGGAEFIREGGRLWFIEFNPRVEAIHFLASAAGLDLVGTEIEHLATGRVPAEGRQRAAMAWVGTAALARLRAQPAILPTLLRDRLAVARSPVRVRAVLDPRDLGPVIELFRLAVQRGRTRMVRRRAGHEVERS